MAIEKVYLSKKGAQADAYASANKKYIEFTKFVVGNGINQSPQDCVVIGDKKFELPIESIENSSAGIFKIRGTFSNKDLLEEFQFNELALYCKNPENIKEDIVYCYGSVLSETEGDKFPPYKKGNFVSHIFDVNVAVTGNMADFTIDDMSKADIKTVEELKNKVNNITNEDSFVIDTQGKFDIWASNATGYDFTSVKIYGLEVPYILNSSEILLKDTRNIIGVGNVKIAANIRMEKIPTEDMHSYSIRNIKLTNDGRFINCINVFNCEGKYENCKNVYSSDGDASLNNLIVNGNITQNGQAYETHAEKIYTKKDMIITRDGAKNPLAVGEYSGILAKKYDSDGNDGILAFDAAGIAKVGDFNTYYTTDGNTFKKDVDSKTGELIGDPINIDSILPKPNKVKNITVNGKKIEVWVSDDSKAISTISDDAIDSSTVVWNSSKKTLETAGNSIVVIADNIKQAEAYLPENNKQKKYKIISREYIIGDEI